MTDTGNAVKVWSVYVLVDPRDRFGFYVGYTGNVERRKRTHKYGHKGVSAYDRIREIRACGMVPMFEVLSEHATREEAMAVEKEYIYGANGLVNVREVGRPRIHADRKAYRAKWMRQWRLDQKSTDQD